MEALEHALPKNHPLRALCVGQGPSDSKLQPTLNLLLRHGVRSWLEYQKSGDINQAPSTRLERSPIPTFRRTFPS